MTNSTHRTRQRRSAGGGQAITELALIAPVIAIILFGIIEISGAYGAKMDLQSASAQAARTGALEGNGGSSTSCPLSLNPQNTALRSGPNAVKVTTDPVDRDIVKAVLGTQGVISSNITQIQVFDATADGSVYGSAINTYVPPFLTTAISGTQTISGATYAASGTAPGWQSCHRNADEQSDSIGIHITYGYHPITPLFGRATLTMDDQTIQHLNPTQNANPCPIPGIPFPVTATVAMAEPPASPSDIITWNQVPSAQGYNVYASVNGGAYTQIYSGPGTVVGNNVQYTYNGNTTYAPTRYEVAGYNACGTGQSSVPAPDGQCPLPTAPLGLTVADSATPSSHDLSWSPVADKSSVYGQYTITQTIGGSTRTYTVNAPTTRGTVGYSDPSYLPVQYTVGYTSACGVAGPASVPVTATVTAPPVMVASTADGQTYVHPGDTLTYTLGFTNTAAQSSATAQSVVMTDTLPNNVTYVNGSCKFPTGSQYSGSTCTYYSAINSLIITLNKSVATGTSNAGNLTFQATVNANATSSVTNIVTLTASDTTGHAQPATTGSETDTVVLEPAMAVSAAATAANSFRAGTAFTYTLSFTNTATQSGATANSVTLNDAFSVGGTGAITVTAETFSGAYSGTCSPAPTTATSNVVCTVTGSVAPGTSGTVTIKAKVNSSASGSTLRSTVNLSSVDSVGQTQPVATASDSHTVP